MSGTLPGVGEIGERRGGGTLWARKRDLQDFGQRLDSLMFIEHRRIQCRIQIKLNIAMYGTDGAVMVQWVADAWSSWR